MEAPEWLDREIFSGNQPWTPFTWRFVGETVLRWTVFYYFIYQIASTIVLAENDAYDMGKFTLWAFTMYTVYWALLLAALFFERWFLTLIVLFFLPVVAGTTVLVAGLILIIIARDAEIYIKGTVCQTPLPSDPRTMEQVHTGDAIEHTIVVFNNLTSLIVGCAYFRYIVVTTLRSWNPVYQWLYFIYWMCSPLLLPVIYQSIFNVRKVYDTSYSVVQLTFMSLGLVWVWMIFLWFTFTARYSKRDFEAFWLPNARELASGQLRGTGAPNPSSTETIVPQFVKL